MSAEIAIQILKTLTRKRAIDLVRTWGPVAISTFYARAASLKEGKAWTQQEMTFREMQEAIPKLLAHIEQKEIRLVPNAFNSTPDFIAYFQTAAMGAVPLILLDVAQSIKRVGASLDNIRNELAISNVARVQGWADDGFGAYVHRFVQNEMASIDIDASGEKHFFYVWNPDSDWYPDFERRQDSDPLGHNFGGYHHDLATICLRMTADRRTLIATTDYGNTAMFHLIIPTYYPLVIDTPIAFAEELLPLTITGGRHRGADLVWLNLDRRSTFPGLQLDFIGVLSIVENPLKIGARVAFVGCWLGGVASWSAAVVFPPCAPIAGTIFLSCWASCATSAAATVAAETYDDYVRKEVQVLGDILFLI
ncbi:hypothetical protein IL306_006949 [Fusarium sp. DS 682]|nr:hypothetical protein IL306_006949 [Fusarium sp. DS 682]